MYPSPPGQEQWDRQLAEPLVLCTGSQNKPLVLLFIGCFCQSDGKLSNIPGIPAPEFCRSWIWERALEASQNLIVGVAHLPEEPTGPTPWASIDVWWCLASLVG